MESSNPDLIFNVAQLLKETVGSTRKHAFETPQLTLSDVEEGLAGAGTLEASKVGGHIKVTKVSDGLLVQGDVEADILLECSRCVDEIALHVDASLEEQFQPVVDIDTGRAVQRAEAADENSFNLDPNHMMDLTEPVRQALLVALPMKPLCRDDCKGLCPQCGQNWNEGECDCEVETFDSRWAGLRQINLEDLPARDTNIN